MISSNARLRTAITDLMTIGAMSAETPMAAAVDHKGMAQDTGVVKTGMNDGATASNARRSHLERNSGAMAWSYQPKGSCERIVGACVVHVLERSPKKR